MTNVALSARVFLDCHLLGLSQRRSAMSPAQEIALSDAVVIGSTSSTMSADRCTALDDTGLLF